MMQCQGCMVCGCWFCDDRKKMTKSPAVSFGTTLAILTKCQANQFPASVESGWSVCYVGKAMLGETEMDKGKTRLSLLMVLL